MGKSMGRGSSVKGTVHMKLSRGIAALLVLCLVLPLGALAEPQPIELLETPEVSEEAGVVIAFTGELGVSYTLYHKHRSVWKLPQTVVLEAEPGEFTVELGQGVNDFILREAGEPREAPGGVSFSIAYNLPAEAGAASTLAAEPSPDVTPEVTASITPEPAPATPPPPVPTTTPTPEPTAGPTPEPAIAPEKEESEEPEEDEGEEPAEEYGEHRIMVLWAKGEDVKALQEGLTGLKYKLGKADGVYGPRTRNAVKRFQRKYGLKIDGLVGPQTRGKLAEFGVKIPKYVEPDMTMPEGFERILTMGMLGMDVRVLQAELIARGYLEGKPDLVYGKKTRNAVRAFQEEMGLKVDGKAGPETLRALFE